MFTDSELAYLTRQHLGRLATQKPNGALQNSPVGMFRYNPDTRTIDIAGHNMEASRKYRNVADNGRAAFVVDDLASVNPWHPRCLEIRGSAEALSADGERQPIIRIHPTRIISYGIDEPDNDVHSYSINARDVS